ncbi:efflux RND transporter periplasmic adaptor subunit [Solimicrobium silvestre]|uniref:Efflux transporter, RND family, MFP subunit n=1 Tax=Solimicrobium silvestre TaxID=2099400 RepID=A0A2S9H154_9BURK|nr:efflux RND transporter periplasmic adaptor subunit [Solimicrobium silvestre]PRC93709.1 Efflux transporter, RND family, MFP subunit [Solimicrobium silvestre]
MQIKHSASTTPKKTLAITVIVILAIAASFYFGISRSNENKKTVEADVPMFTVQADKLLVPPESPLRKRLVVAAVSSASPVHSIDIPGVVEADPANTVNILPPLSGRLIELKVKLGDAVKAGQVVAIISSSDLAQAYSDADKARDALDLAQRALQRGEGVNSAGANAAKDLEQIKSNHNQAQAEFNRAEQRLKTLGVANDSNRDSKNRVLTISTPISGTVTVLNNGAGSYINDATASIMTVANLDHVWVTANVPESLVSTLHKGQNAEITLAAYAGETWQGKISTISAILEPDTHRNKARIIFSNTDGRLKPNMYANVKLATAQAGKLMIPTSALLMNNDSITVFVETTPWTFVRRTVSIGSEDGDQVSVLSGLAAGERVIVRGGVLIND